MDTYKENEGNNSQTRLRALLGTQKQSNSADLVQDFDFKSFTSFIQATKASIVALEVEEARNTFETAMFNMKNSLDFFFSNTKDISKIIEILDYLNSYDFIGLLNVGIDYSTNPEINLNSISMLSSILGANVQHPIYENECLNEEMVNKLFILVKSPSSCCPNKSEFSFAFQGTLKDLFSNFDSSMKPHVSQSITTYSLSAIAGLLSKKPVLINFVQENSLVDILLEVKYSNKAMIELSTAIMHIIIKMCGEMSQPIRDIDVYTRFFSSNVRIENKPYIPAIEGLLICLKYCENSEQIANDVIESNVCNEVLGMLSEQNIELRKIICWLLMEISEKAEESHKEALIHMIDWDTFFAVPKDDKIMQLSLIAARIILVNCPACAEDVIMKTPYLTKFIQCIQERMFDVKKCSMIQLSKIVMTTTEALLIELVKNFGIDDLIVDFFDEDDTDMLLAATNIGVCIINAFKTTEDIGEVVEKLFDSSIVDCVDSFQDSDDAELSIACINFMSLYDEFHDESSD